MGNVVEACSVSQWSTELSTRAARVRDLIDCELSARDFINQPEAPCGYSVGDHVLLSRPGRYQKRHPSYEPGWVVTSIVVPSTVVVAKLDGSQQLKTVSVDVLKPDPLGDIAPKSAHLKLHAAAKGSFQHQSGSSVNCQRLLLAPHALAVSDL